MPTVISRVSQKPLGGIRLLTYYASRPSPPAQLCLAFVKQLKTAREKATCTSLSQFPRDTSHKQDIHVPEIYHFYKLNHLDLLVI